MIQITEKAKCCGCTACYSICPKKCITMEADHEGFLYPKVDESACVNCHTCEKVCPFYKESGMRSDTTLYAAIQNLNDVERNESTAGGAFSLIANYILDNHGVVYAVRYEDMIVVHKQCEEENELSEFRGSKYVQSTLNNTYRQIKEVLKEKKVLFVGTPCQVHGLINYIGKNDNLYTLDLLCLGVSSPALFDKYVSFLKTKYNANVSKIQFRNKNYGYAVPNVRVYFENNTAIDQTYDSKVHANLFFKYLNVRPSCYECHYRELPRVSDFTIGDFNDIGSVDKDMDDDLGTTRIWIHSEKGRTLIKMLEDKCKMHVLAECSNIVGGTKKQITLPQNRDQFFVDASKLEYNELIAKWEPNSLKSQLICLYKRNSTRFVLLKKLNKHIRRLQQKIFNKNVKQININGKEM